MQYKLEGVVDARLATLLEFSKKGIGLGKDWTWRSVAEALAPIYGPHMRLRDVVHHVVTAYLAAVREKRFELGGVDQGIEALVLAPIYGTSSIEMMGPASTETMYSVEQYYNAIVLRILGEFSITRVDWLREAVTEQGQG